MHLRPKILFHNLNQPETSIKGSRAVLREGDQNLKCPLFLQNWAFKVLVQCVTKERTNKFVVESQSLMVISFMRTHFDGKQIRLVSASFMESNARRFIVTTYI
jgi:hypothetical protein